MHARAHKHRCTYICTKTTPFHKIPNPCICKSHIPKRCPMKLNTSDLLHDVSCYPRNSTHLHLHNINHHHHPRFMPTPTQPTHKHAKPQTQHHKDITFTISCSPKNWNFKSISVFDIYIYIYSLTHTQNSFAAVEPSAETRVSSLLKLNISPLLSSFVQNQALSRQKGKSMPTCTLLATSALTRAKQQHSHQKSYRLCPW
jgi:hypothetical protein